MRRTLVLLVVFWVGEAHAFWGTERGNLARTGVQAGAAELELPVKSWKHYLGGDSRSGVVAISGDFIVTLTGGAVEAYRTNGQSVWRRVRLNVQQIVGIRDLDGNGSEEVVVFGRHGVAVLDLTSGQLLWSGDADFGSPSTVRLFDSGQDGIWELLVVECVCCAYFRHSPSRLYRMDSVFAPTLVAELTQPVCGSYYSTAIFEDPSGDDHIWLGSNDRFFAVDGTGVQIAETPDLGERMAQADCVAAELDGSAGDEILCVMSTVVSPLPGTGHRVLAFDFAGGAITTLWETDLGTDDNSLYITSSPVIDLDSNGQNEVVIGYRFGGNFGYWLLNGQTGAVGSFQDEQWVGNWGNWVLALDGNELRVRTGGLLLPQEVARLQDLRPFPGRDADLAMRQFAAPTILSANRGPNEEIFLTSLDGKEIVLLDTIALTTSSLASSTHSVATGERFDTGFLFLDRFGQVDVRGADLSLTTHGVRIGGYWISGRRREWTRSIVAGPSQDEQYDSVVCTNSQSSLLRLDVGEADIFDEITPVWERPNTDSPVLVAQDESSFVVGSQTVNGERSLVAMGLDDGALVWETVYPASVQQELLADDGSVIVTYAAGNRLTHKSYALATGSLRWEGPLLGTGGTVLPSGAAMADWNDDGVADVVQYHDGAVIIDGATGLQIASGPALPNVSYFAPTVANIDEDEGLELVLSNGFYPPRVLDDDLTEDILFSEVTQPFADGALFKCGSNDVFAVSSFAEFGLLEFLDLDAGVSQGIWLGEGGLYGSGEAADAAGAVRFEVNNVVGSGPADEPVLLVSASDGFLYAIDPCAQTLHWAMDFEAPVGQIAIADTDGNGKWDFIVSVADGYLYGIRNEQLDAPEKVFDIDPETNAGVDVDLLWVSDIEVPTTVSAIWDAVAQAESYEIRLVKGLDETWATAWVPVSETSAELIGLELEVDVLYQFEVRAKDSFRVSRVVRSDGFVVRTGEQGNGGCCKSRDDASVFELLLLGLLLGAAQRRKFRLGRYTFAK